MRPSAIWFDDFEINVLHQQDQDVPEITTTNIHILMMMLMIDYIVNQQIDNALDYEQIKKQSTYEIAQWSLAIHSLLHLC